MDGTPGTATSEELAEAIVARIRKEIDTRLEPIEQHLWELDAAVNALQRAGRK